MADERLNGIVNQLISSSDPEEVRQLYRQWSSSYDQDLESFGYVAPLIGARLFAGVLADRKAKIHDAGCGTGLVGNLLSELGYQCIDGSDFSPDMLERAAQTGSYQALSEADFSCELEFADESYDGILSIGVYSKRFSEWFIPEMLRILRPGGYFLFTCRELYFEEVAATLTKIHQGNVISASTIIFDDYMVGQGASAYYIGLTKSVG